MLDLNRCIHPPKNQSPVVHCLTNPIAITDMANILLTMGCSPIMAEHPGEVSSITRGASLLLINLGSITEARMEAMRISIATARAHDIPILLDLVGVSASQLRLQFVEELLSTGPIDILKGNYSEWLSLVSGHCTTGGVDSHVIDVETMMEMMSHRKPYATISLATGKEDLLFSRHQVSILFGGHERMSKITGTGCMLGAVIAAAYVMDHSFASMQHAVSLFLRAGELAAERSKGPGSFRTALLDQLETLVNHPEEVMIRCKNRSI